MDRIKLLLADGSQTLLELLGEKLGRMPDMEITARTDDGAKVLCAVAEHQPDILVMDLILPRCDGFMVLEQLAQMDESCRPKVLVLTSLSRDDFILRALKLGAAYYMVKPFDIQLLCDRIRDISSAGETVIQDGHALNESSSAADEQLTNLFLTLGIPANIKGYQYLREAVLMVLSDRSLTGRITKELYPGVAKRFGATPSKVERAMRHAIEVAWNRGRLDTVNRMYGHRLFEKQDRPSNSEFISCIAEKLLTGRTA